MVIARLYDLDKDDHPKYDGNEFGTIQVFQCEACGALTNRVKIQKSRLTTYRVTICPNGHHCWHHEIENFLKRLKETHPKSYLNACKREIKALRRQHVKDIKNDLVGEPDMKCVVVRSLFETPRRCKHGLV